MKKINPKKYLLVAILVFIAVGLLISILLQDFVVDIIISNTMVWYYINQAKPFIIFVILGIIFVYFLRDALSKQIFLSKTMEDARMNQIQVLENIKKEFFFFRHTPVNPFDFISVGIYEIFGYQRDDFKKNFKKYGFGFLYENVTGLIGENKENFIISPEYEHTAFSSDGKKKYIQVKYTPVFNNQGIIIAVEGVVRDITEFKHTEEKLIEKELMYHTLFEANNEAVVILKADKFIDCNKKLTELFHASIEEIIMHTPYSYRFSPSVQPDGRSSRDKSLEKIRLALSGYPQVYVWQHLKSSGEPVMVEVSLTRFKEGQDYYLFGILRELDAEILAKQDLKTQIDNFTNIIQNSPFAVSVFNNDRIFTEINNPFISLIGLSKEKILKTSVAEIFSGENISNCFTKCCNGENAYYTGTYTTLDQKQIFIQATFIPAYSNLSKPDGGIVIIEELTELQQIKSRFTECEQGMKDILMNAREILYKVNCKTGKYEYMSNSVTEVLGYIPDEIYSMNSEEIKDLLHPEDREKSNMIIAKLIVPEPGQEVKRIIDYRIKHKDGSYRWFSDKYTVLFNKEGQPSFISGNVIDITKFKEAEELIRKAAPGNTEAKD